MLLASTMSTPLGTARISKVLQERNQPTLYSQVLSWRGDRQSDLGKTSKIIQIWYVWYVPLQNTQNDKMGQ